MTTDATVADAASGEQGADSLGHPKPVPQGSAAENGASTAELPPGQSLESFLEKLARQLITRALEATRWNKTAAAKRLGIAFRALRYRLKKLELE